MDVFESLRFKFKNNTNVVYWKYDEIFYVVEISFCNDKKTF